MENLIQTMQRIDKDSAANLDANNEAILDYINRLKQISDSIGGAWGVNDNPLTGIDPFSLATGNYQTASKIANSPESTAAMMAAKAAINAANYKTATKIANTSTSTAAREAAKAAIQTATADTIKKLTTPSSSSNNSFGSSLVSGSGTQNANGTSMALPQGVTGVEKRFEGHLFKEGSNQKALQSMAFSDDLGFRRINVEGLDKPAYMVALGSFYTSYDSRGTIFEIKLENGTNFYCVAGDMKADVDTNSTNQYTVGKNITTDNTDIVEFIMDRNDNRWSTWEYYGVINRAPGYEMFNSPIVSITKFDQTVLR